MDGVQTFGYAEIGEVHDGTHQATLGILVHELGHLTFGLPDLYDLDFSSSGIGGFGVMGAGAWGRDVLVDTYQGETPVLPSAWTTYKLGWVNPRAGGTLASSGRFAMPTLKPYGGIAHVGEENTPDIWVCFSDEYFLMQYRTNVGYDAGLNAFLDPTGGNFTGGVTIYHVDEGVDNNDRDFRRLVDVEEANGVAMGLGTGLNDHLWYQANVSLFNGTTTPSTDSNTAVASGVEIEVLGEWVNSSGENVITTRVDSECDLPLFQFEVLTLPPSPAFP